MYVVDSVYFLEVGIQEPGWNVFAVLVGSSEISCLPKLVAAAWPLAPILAGVATRPSSYSLACRARSFSSTSLAFSLICSLYNSFFSSSYKMHRWTHTYSTYSRFMKCSRAFKYHLWCNVIPSLRPKSDGQLGRGIWPRIIYMDIRIWMYYICTIFCRYFPAIYSNNS